MPEPVRLDWATDTFGPSKISLELRAMNDKVQLLTQAVRALASTSQNSDALEEDDQR